MNRLSTIENRPSALASMLELFSENRNGKSTGIYSVCASHPLVLEAAMRQADIDGSIVLIESTANQVNQFGGYTGMVPADFPRFVGDIADKIGFPHSRIVFGGDHLGPVCWTDETADRAMEKACVLVNDYVRAGFQKIHLDASMACAGETGPLPDEVVAERAVALCRAAEAAATEKGAAEKPVYVVGTEVPVPGGETEGLDELEVTTVERARYTIETHRIAFESAGLVEAWKRVVALVVQPGVEFNHTDVHVYDPPKAADLSKTVLDFPRIVYEAHSTDYQPSDSYLRLINDHFAILKVGPQLTFALREALFALAAIEDELVEEHQRSDLIAVCEHVMQFEPAHWRKHYGEGGLQSRILRRFSYSDRIRYYWPHPHVSAAVGTMFRNLSETPIPLPLLSQYLPTAIGADNDNQGSNVSRELVIRHIMRVCATYAGACTDNG